MTPCPRQRSSDRGVYPRERKQAEDEGIGSIPTLLKSAPELFKPCRVRGRVPDGVLNAPMPQIVLDEPRVRALVSQGEAASVAQHVGMSEQGKGSRGAVFSQSQVDSCSSPKSHRPVFS